VIYLLSLLAVLVLSVSLTLLVTCATIDGVVLMRPLYKTL
jgi:hypothetical protein